MSMAVYWPYTHSHAHTPPRPVGVLCGNEFRTSVPVRALGLALKRATPCLCWCWMSSQCPVAVRAERGDVETTRRNKKRNQRINLFHGVRVRSNKVVDNGRLREGAGVTQFRLLHRRVSRDLAEDSAHDLATSGLREPRSPVEGVRRRESTHGGPHQALEVLHEVIAGLSPGVECHVDVEGLALDGVVHTDRRS